MATKSKFETIDKGTQHFETELAQISDMSDCMRKLNAQKSLDGVREMLEIPKSSATLVSPILDGVPEAPTAEPGTNSSQVATTAFVAEAVSELLGSAPETLDTIQELSDALGNDPNFSTTIMDLVSEKLPLSGGTVTGDLKVEGEASASSFKGSLTGDVKGNVTGSLKGNADTATLAAEATKLATVRTIDGIEFNGEGAIQHFGVCSTAAESKEKAVACVGYKLTTGSRIEVKFSTTNTATGPTLNVNNTGAKPVFYRGAAIGAGNLAANRVYSFVYNGAQYELIGDINTDTNTAMTQNVSAANASYPVLLTPAANATVNQGAKTGIFAAGVRVNPSTKSLETDGRIVCTNSAQTEAGLVVKGINSASSNHEGGQIDLAAATGEANMNGIRLDTWNGGFRVMGLASSDGKTKVGTGAILTVDPYSKKVSGGYTFEGNVTGSSGSCTGNAATATKATGDKNGNDIAATYLPRTGGTMTGDLTISGDNPCTFFKDMRSARGTPPASDEWNRFLSVRDKNGVCYGLFEHAYKASGENKMAMVVFPGTDNTMTTNAQINVGFDSNGNWFTYAPTPAAEDSSDKIVTTRWIRHATGNTSLNAATANYLVNVQSKTLTKGTNPTETVWTRSSIVFDKAGTATANRLNEWRNCVDSSGKSCNELVAYDFASDGTSAAILGIYKEKGGAAYAMAPTPADNDNTTKIATTAWVQKFCNTTKKFLTAHQSLTNYLPLTGGTVKGGLNVGATGSGEGGEIHIQAADGAKAQNGFVLDQCNNKLRIFGIQSADGTSRKGTGTPLEIDPYGKTIIGGYTFTGNVTGNVSGSSGSCTGNAATATKAAQLTTARTVDGVSFNGTANITHYGSCSTAAATAAKTVACTGFTLATGARIEVKFTVTNTAANPTLNVNSTGAKAIYYRGAAISAGYLAANRTYTFIYNGTQYELVGDLNTDTNNVTAQNISTANATYPILLGNTANATANIGNKAALFGKGVKVNPSTSEVVATKFTGALNGNAATATKINGKKILYVESFNTSTGELKLKSLA